MKNVVMLASAGALSLLLAGCAPELDKTQLSPEEQAWAESIKANYGAWQPPESVPRSVRRDDLAAQNNAAANGDVVPPAADGPTAVAPVAEAPAAAAVPPAEPVEAVAPEAVAAAPAVVAPSAPVAEAAPEVYTVVKGDTLGDIARKYYGKASAWKRIQEANMNVIRGKNKDVIVPGMKLQIPRP